MLLKEVHYYKKIYFTTKFLKTIILCIKFLYNTKEMYNILGKVLNLFLRSLLLVSKYHVAFAPKYHWFLAILLPPVVVIQH